MESLMPTFLLIAQGTILLVMLAGYIVVHYGPQSLRHRVSHYYHTHIHG
jgi:hypothetical protein